MGDQRSMLEGSSASMDDSRPWTEVSASNAQHASRNKEHLDFLLKYVRSMVSVGRKIGEGGQCCVYEAKFHLPYSLMPVPVVVKKFKPLEGVSQGHFPLELGSVKSYNLCVPHGVFFEGDSLSMIMRRFSCDLRAAIDFRMKALQDEVLCMHGSPFTEEIGRIMILQLASGLKVLHESGVYLGDLKAANILLKTFSSNYETSLLEPAHLVIADFERSEGVVGTAFWRAPEVLQSLVTNIPLSKEQWLLGNIYSFGMVCYEVFTGMIPFQGHPVSDYGLVLNGEWPKLADHVSKPMRYLILKCWHEDPHSRPNWSEIMEVLVPNEDALTFGTYINNMVSIDSLSFESIMHESKQLVQDLTALHESDSKSFKSEFMPYYWASEFLATVEEYASKFDVVSFLDSPLVCSAQEASKRMKLCALLTHQMYGAKFGLLTFLDLIFEGHLDMVEHIYETTLQREALQIMLLTLYMKVFQEFSKMEFTNEYEIGTSRTNKLLIFMPISSGFCSMNM